MISEIIPTASSASTSTIHPRSQRRPIFDGKLDEATERALAMGKALRCCGCGTPTPIAGIKIIGGEHGCKHAFCIECLSDPCCMYDGKCIAGVSSFLDCNQIRADGTVVIVSDKDTD